MIKNKKGFTGLEVLVLMALGALISTGIAAIEGHFHGHWNCVGNAKCEGKKNLAKVDIFVDISDGNIRPDTLTSMPTNIYRTLEAK